MNIFTRYIESRRRAAWLELLASRRREREEVERELLAKCISTAGRWRVSVIGFWSILWTYSDRARHVQINGKFATMRTAIRCAESMDRTYMLDKQPSSL